MTRFRILAFLALAASLAACSDDANDDETASVTQSYRPAPSPDTDPPYVPLPFWVGCSPAIQAVPSGTPAVVHAQGGDGVGFAWSAPNGSPTTGEGRRFAVTHTNTTRLPAIRQITVTSAGLSATCTIRVLPASP
jgi:hypothetical protein